MILFLGGVIVGGVMGFLWGLLHTSRCAGRTSFNPTSSHDRRGQQKAAFPLSDCDGVLVLADRRMQLDRRLSDRRH